jgi:DNA-binding CsgD family transcriptional regulator
MLQIVTGTATRTAAATQAKRDTREFNHKAAHAMAVAGESIAEIAKVLELSKNAVYKYLAEPCPALAVELAQAKQHVVEHRSQSLGMSFCLPEDSICTEKEARVTAMRTEINEMLGRKMRKAEIARTLGITPQLLQYHVKRINEPATADG